VMTSGVSTLVIISITSPFVEGAVHLRNQMLIFPTVRTAHRHSNHLRLVWAEPTTVCQREMTKETDEIAAPLAQCRQ
jgi:hypothetical protein